MNLRRIRSSGVKFNWFKSLRVSYGIAQIDAFELIIKITKKFQEFLKEFSSPLFYHHQLITITKFFIIPGLLSGNSIKFLVLCQKDNKLKVLNFQVRIKTSTFCLFIVVVQKSEVLRAESTEEHRRRVGRETCWHNSNNEHNFGGFPAWAWESIKHENTTFWLFRSSHRWLISMNKNISGNVSCHPLHIHN